jgi:hypothetical protein
MTWTRFVARANTRDGERLVNDAVEFQTDSEPLGPARHEYLGKNLFASAALLHPVGPFRDAFPSRGERLNGSKIISGRQGSGKSAVMLGYSSMARFGQPSGTINKELINKNFSATISDFSTMHRMVESVAKKVQTQFQGLDHDFVTPEHLNEYWAEEIWSLIMNSLYSDYRNGDESREIKKFLPSLIKYFEQPSFHNSISKVLDDQKRFCESFKNEMEQFYLKEGRRIFLLIDSLEEYPIRNSLWQKIAKGFLKCIKDFSIDRQYISVVACVPQELDKFLVEYSSNLDKDFGGSHKLDWRPMDILGIVAHRFRMYVNIEQGPIAPEFIKQINGLDLFKRPDLQYFFSRVMQDDIINSIEKTESSLAYIIRHTNLLPREFIIIFNDAIRYAIQMTRSSSYIVAEAIVKAVENNEERMIKNRLKPYQTVYPRFLTACDKILTELSPMCTKSDFDRIESQFKGLIEEDITSPWQTLYDMGIIGQAVRQGDKFAETERYQFVNFNFNSTEPFNLSSRDMYCFHPLFSRKWGINKNRTVNMKMVYPANVGDSWLDLS